MKTEARKILSNLNDGRITVSQATEQVMYLIEQAQKEAYNKAIDDAVNSVKVVNTKRLNFETGKWENIPLINQTSILKLKK